MLGTLFGKLPLSWLLLSLGLVLNLVGCVGYVDGNSTLNLVGTFYGVPVLLGGFALKAAELKPVPYEPIAPAEIVELRDRQATATQNQVRQYVTRYRYGQAAHLDEALKKLGLAPTDEERPKLLSVAEVDREGRYGLVLAFDSPRQSFEQWQAKLDKMERFFGPGIRAELVQGEGSQVRLTLVAV